jgi:5-methylcytosine-specific restriction protein A
LAEVLEPHLTPAGEYAIGAISNRRICVAGWAGSDRRSRLPENWPKLRNHILKRDGKRCTHLDDRGNRCPEPATDVDHIIAGDNHDESNLRSLCRYHHLKKSGREGGSALAAVKRKNSQKFKRVEQHPGLL